MVCPDERLSWRRSRCVELAGESPVAVSAVAPRSRSPAEGEIQPSKRDVECPAPDVRRAAGSNVAGPTRKREPCSLETLTPKGEEAEPIMYVPYTQVEQILGEVQVRTSGDVSAVASTVFRALTDVDRRLATVGMMTADDRVDASLAAENMVAKLSSVFGLVALALAAVGLSGLVAYMTAQRTQEIGVRMALGAGTREVRRLVLGNTIRLVALGAGIGIPAALALARLLSGLLYQVEPYDPVVLSLSVGVLVCVALVAGYLPAQRAARVDPIKALRAE